MRKAMLFAVMLTVGLISTPGLAAKDYYKWTDENGVTHYSARKPHGKAAEVVSVTTGQRVEVPGSESGAGQEDETTGGTAGSQTANNQTAGKDPERCQAARENLDILRNNARVRMQDENGETRYLSEEEKQENISKFEKAVAESC